MRFAKWFTLFMAAITTDLYYSMDQLRIACDAGRTPASVAMTNDMLWIEHGTPSATWNYQEAA